VFWQSFFNPVVFHLLGLLNATKGNYGFVMELLLPSQTACNCLLLRAELGCSFLLSSVTSVTNDLM
jgi:hypothetical protein